LVAITVLAVVEGIDVAPVSAWLEQHVAGATGPFTFERIGGGRSNLTFAVTGGTGRRFVLRRPPLHHVLATAHDMTREYRAISAIGPTAVPVPGALGLCTDDAVNGAPFYVMTLVEGAVVDSIASAQAISRSARATMAADLADVLGELHRLDVDAVGLGDFARREGYIDRQIARWSKQWNESRTRDLPAVDDVAALLACRVPAQQGVAVVHGDYRFGNCIADPSTGAIRAVLDWELCTLGDPLADVGYVGAHWAGDGGRGRHNDPTGAGGFGSFDDFLGRYAKHSSRDLAAIDFYVGFQLWRTAIILEGVYARYLGGAYGGQQLGAELDILRDAPVELVQLAQAALARLP
jgi:aminoglycoside phosphotransferase (APT) family kinase protein